MDSEKQTESFRGEGRGGLRQARPVIGIKDGTYCMVQANNESWNIASKSGDVLYGD